MTKDIVLSDGDRYYLKTHIEEALKPKLRLLTELEIQVVEKYALDFYTLAFIRFYDYLRHDLTLSLLDHPSTDDVEFDQEYFNNFFENYVKQEMKEYDVNLSLSFIVKACGFDCYKLGYSKCKANLKNRIAEVFSES